MSLNLDATYVKTLTGSTELNERIEIALDTTIDALNVYDSGLPNLSGSAGSMSVLLTSQQRGAIMSLFRYIFVNYIKNPNGITATALGNLSMSYSELMSSPAVQEMIKTTAYQLKKRVFERTYR
jgi:hypothetical protein